MAHSLCVNAILPFIWSACELALFRTVASPPPVHVIASRAATRQPRPSRLALFRTVIVPPFNPQSAIRNATSRRLALFRTTVSHQRDTEGTDVTGPSERASTFLYSVVFRSYNLQCSVSRKIWTRDALYYAQINPCAKCTYNRQLGTANRPLRTAFQPQRACPREGGGHRGHRAKEPQMNADRQPGTVNRELTTHLHPQISQTHADSDSVIPAKLVLDPRSG